MNSREVANVILGLWKIALIDKKCFNFFSGTEEGFWRSFQAAAVIAPLHLIYEWGLYINSENTSPFLRVFTIEILEYVILWVLYPLVMIYISKALKREEKYFIYMTAYNWFQMGIGLILMPIVILSVFGKINLQASNILETIIFLSYIFYSIFIAREALKIPTGSSLSIVLIDILLTLMVSQIVIIFAQS